MARQSEKQARSASDQAGVLEELKAVATRLGYDVREEKLLREVGYRVRSGSCRVRDTRVILLDRGLSVNAQIEILAEELAGQPLDELYVSPAARRLLEAAPSSEGAAGSDTVPPTP